MRSRWAIAAGLAAAAIALGGCGGHASDPKRASTPTVATNPKTLAILPQAPKWAVLDPSDVYAADSPGDMSPVVRHDRPLVYVPNSEGDSVDEIDPRTYKIVRQFAVGALPQHVIPSYDLRTLYVANDEGNSLTPINPANGLPGRPIPVTDPYNMYFTWPSAIRRP